jgi:hypothetical protein
MAYSRKRGGSSQSSEREVREQEVLRANRELTAYFKGRRTEREARAALKIIKAFVKACERTPGETRPLLPRVRTAKVASAHERTTAPGKARHPRPRRNSPPTVLTTHEAGHETPARPDEESARSRGSVEPGSVEVSRDAGEAGDAGDAGKE